MAWGLNKGFKVGGLKTQISQKAKPRGPKSAKPLIVAGKTGLEGRAGETFLIFSNTHHPPRVERVFRFLSEGCQHHR